MRVLTTFAILALSLNTFDQAFAQLPDCSGPSAGKILYSYPSYTSTGTIYNLDPSLPFSSTNPAVNSISLPLGASGLTYCDNLSGSGPAKTLYTVASGFFYYYNGSSWVNTGHTAGSGTAVNLGGSNGIIYNGDFISGNVYKYDGSGNATLLMAIPALGGVADLFTDCDDNIYYLNTIAPQALQKFNPAGVLTGSYTITGVPVVSGGGGLARIGDSVYFDNGSQFFRGAIVGGNIDFTATGSPTPIPIDFAFCSGDVGMVHADKDTAFYCGSGPGVAITAAGASAYAWTVISGHPVISGSGASIIVTSTEDAAIELSALTASTCGGPGKDTVHIIVPTANVDAGSAKNLYSCDGRFIDTLSAFLADTSAQVVYYRTWAPADAISAAANGLRPIINLAGTTTFTLLISTPPGQGGCEWSDSVTISAIDMSVFAGFIPSVQPDCSHADVTFINTSINATKYSWDLGAGITSSEQNPERNYMSEGDKFITLVSANDYCADTISQAIAVNFVPGFTLAGVTPDVRVKYGASIQLNAAGGVFYTWSPGNLLDNPNINNPVATVYEPTHFTVYSRTNNGCEDTATVFVDIDYTMSDNIPSAFTPNGDGKNDVFRVVNLTYQKLEQLCIYNRWGEPVFMTSNAEIGWDGTYKGVPQENGTYFYLARMSLPDGTEKTCKGDVTLLR